jgi:hypothetical protein
MAGMAAGRRGLRRGARTPRRRRIRPNTDHVTLFRAMGHRSFGPNFVLADSLGAAARGTVATELTIESR